MYVFDYVTYINIIYGFVFSLTEKEKEKMYKKVYSSITFLMLYIEEAAVMKQWRRV